MPGHRAIGGGFWEEIGHLQFEFLKQQGLRPEHRLLDVGCGCLRGGIHFVQYLDATFFQAPHSAHLNPILHPACEYPTHYDSDPFHYSFEEIKELAENANFATELIGDWQHPRSQKMLCFTHKGER